MNLSCNSVKAVKAADSDNEVTIDKGKKKVESINDSTVYLADVQKPWCVSLCVSACGVKVVFRFIKDQNELPECAVMQPILQDYVIKETYQNLPWVR